MKSDLDQLIDYYEAQELTFEKQLQECLHLHDYLGAHDYSQVISRIKAELNLLYNLKDPQYNEKLSLDMMIKRVKTEPHYMQAFWEKRIDEQKNLIQEKIKYNDNFFYDSQEIDDALFRLFERKIKEFSLHLKEDYSLYFHFELSEANILNILIETKAVLNSNFTSYSDNKWSSFEKLGFSLNEEETMLTFHYDMGGFKDASDLKILLARVVFNIYCYSYQSFNSAFLVIKAVTT